MKWDGKAFGGRGSVLKNSLTNEVARTLDFSHLHRRQLPS